MLFRSPGGTGAVPRHRPRPGRDFPCAPWAAERGFAPGGGGLQRQQGGRPLRRAGPVRRDGGQRRCGEAAF